MRRQLWSGAMTLLMVVWSGTAHLNAEDKSKTAGSTAGSPLMLSPTEVKWGECPPAVPPGAQCAVIQGDMTAANELFTFRVKMPDNFQIAPHFHPADEHLVVISGVFNMGMGATLDKSSGHAMSAGSFMVMPKGEPHFAWTTGETVIQVYAIGPWALTYLNPEDDPRQNLPSE
jgi:quercetin dioxygenase-like cupin family protein